MAKKSSFMGQLAKGFVRSAVNQVGRDYGRTISNQLYGDAHSVPVRSAGNNSNFSAYDTGNSTPPSLPNSNNSPQNVTIKTPGTGKYVAWFIFLFLTMGLAGIIMIIRGIIKLNSSTAPCYYVTNEEQRKADARYSVGYRVTGYRQVRKDTKIPKNQIDEWTLKQYHKHAKIYIIIGVVALVLCFAYYFAFFMSMKYMSL